jgi:16S rRNA processing protein RimM
MSRRDSENQNHDINNTGSSTFDEPVYLTIGQLGRSHGLHGEILMYLTTDFPERIKQGNVVFIGKNYSPFTIEQARHHNKGLLLKFENVDQIEDLEKLTNALVFVRTDSLPPLPDGEYYHHQLLGLAVVTESGQEVGVLTEILETGANDVYVVIDSKGKEELIPALNQNLVKIDIKNKIMVVRLLDYFNQD